MGASFSRVIPLLIDYEGDNVVKDPHDYGGLTRYGISQRQYPTLDITALSFDDACLILERDFWVRYRLSEIKEQIIANQIFFTIINMNPLKAMRIIQLAINASGRGVINVKVDGVLGTLSIQAINSLAPYWLSDRIRLETCRYYLELTDLDKSQIDNFRGWIRRALK